MVTLRIRVPAPSGMLFANAVAVLGLIAIVIAIGGLWGAWVATMVGGVIATVLGWVGMTQAAAVEQAGSSTPAAASVDEHQAVVEQLPVASPVAEAAAA